MTADLQTRAIALFMSLLSEDWAGDAVAHLRIDYQRKIQAGRAPVLCRMDMLGKALGMVWREQYQRGVAYLLNANFTPMLRGDGDPRWYREYATFLIADFVAFILLMIIGSVFTHFTDSSFLLLIVVATAFCISAAVFAVGKIAFRHGEFMLVAAVFYLLPMAIVLSIIPAFALCIFPHCALLGWIVFAAQISFWMTTGIVEFHGNWIERSEPSAA